MIRSHFPVPSYHQKKRRIEAYWLLVLLGCALLALTGSSCSVARTSLGLHDRAYPQPFTDTTSSFITLRHDL
ncbi:hypothetical protein [Hymenobacter glacieicola]|uniref:H repeat-associated protein N-terminal domain-containing protein n=1 Tax=Hymenobacter glacieicola TaxID=1562124 RepID=A0ABQ1X9T3_9BACT|nr:hypothetical protein [Hymenobacter glacieicola]GGG60864.1 hypothetical protein GCM10011378_41110 [Hymenobacter glacieicola]